MPMTHRVDQEAGMVRLRCWGILTNEEMLTSVERMHGDPARRPGMPSLVDCRDIEEMRVTPSGMEAAAAIEQALVDPAQESWAIAIIAPQEDVFRLGRIYEALRVGSPAKVGVFRDAADAEDWLRRQSVG